MQEECVFLINTEVISQDFSTMTQIHTAKQLWSFSHFMLATEIETSDESIHFSWRVLGGCFRDSQSVKAEDDGELSSTQQPADSRSTLSRCLRSWDTSAAACL